MIIYPSGFALSEQNLDRPRIGWQTYTRDLPTATVTVSSETAAGPKDAPLRDNSYEAWVPSAAPAWWQIDFGSLGQFYDIDYVGLLGNFGSMGATVLVETTTDVVNYTTFAASLQPADDSAVMLLDTQRSIRAMRLTLDKVCRVSVIYLGLVLKMQKNVAGGYPPITMSRDTMLFNALSRGGQFLNQSIRRNGLVGAISFRNLTAAWVRSSFDPFAKSARTYAYFIGWNPRDFPLEVAYCWPEKDIIAKYSGLLDLMDVSWNMRGLGNS